MKPHHHAPALLNSSSGPACPCSTLHTKSNHPSIRRRFGHRHPFLTNHQQLSLGNSRQFNLSLSSRRSNLPRCSANVDFDQNRAAWTRRAVLLAPPFLATATWLLGPASSSADGESSLTPVVNVPVSPPKEEVIASRIYDATVIGEPMALGKDKSKVWDKLMNARVVYLGEAEQVPIKDDKELELEIVRNLRKRCIESQRRLALAMEAFPCDLQQLLDEYMEKKFASSFLFLLFLFSHQLICVFASFCTNFFI